LKQYEDTNNESVDYINCMSWNIQGLGGKIMSKEFIEFCTKFDIFGFSETWAKSNNDFSNSFSGFQAFCKARKKHSKKGRHHGGVAIFVNKTIIKGVKQLSSKLEDAVFLLLNKSFFELTRDVILGCVYIPPEGSNEYTFRCTENGIEELENELNDMVSQNNADIILTGDFNSRTGVNSDFIIGDDNDVQPHIHECYERDNFSMCRQNKDRVTNNFGKSFLNMCGAFNIHILNGRFPNDQYGEFTCVANKGKSVVDYTIASTSLFHRIRNFEIHDNDESDHFPQGFVVKCLFPKNNASASYTVYSESADVNKCCTLPLKYRWKERNKIDFIETLKKEMVDIERDVNKYDMPDDFVKCITDAIQTAGSKMSTLCTKMNVCDQPEWFDSDCIRLKAVKYQSLRKFRNTGTMVDLRNYKQSKDVFKTNL
jgi:exonuclease III